MSTFEKVIQTEVLAVLESEFRTDALRWGAFADALTKQEIDLKNFVRNSQEFKRVMAIKGYTEVASMDAMAWVCQAYADILTEAEEDRTYAEVSRAETVYEQYARGVAVLIVAACPSQFPTSDEMSEPMKLALSGLPRNASGGVESQHALNIVRATVAHLNSRTDAVEWTNHTAVVRTAAHKALGLYQRKGVSLSKTPKVEK